jgi:hypothetical protein
MSSSSPQPTTAEASGASDTGANAASNAAALYERISADSNLTQSLFRQALQDPGGALDRIVQLGEELQLPVSRDQVKAHVATLDDGASKQWLLKARGGL